MPTYCDVFNEIVPEISVEVQLILCGQVDAYVTGLEEFFVRAQPYWLGSWVSTGLCPSLTPARWMASLRYTVALLVRSPRDRDGFSAAPNRLLR